jgi:PAS domain S-box-containing protein
MNGWFAGQMDFVFFAYGCVYFLLAVAAQALRNQPKHVPPWGWLMTFGIFCGVNLWLESLVPVVHHHPPSFQPLQALTRVVAFLCLLEFGRAGLARMRCRVPGPWLHLLPLGLVALAAGWSTEHTAHAVLRYSLYFPAGMLAALALARYCRTLPAAVCRLHLAVLGLALYAALTGLFAGTATSWPPASFLNTAQFREVFELPLQLVRTGLVLLVGIGLWRHHRWEHARAVEATRGLAWWYYLRYLLPLAVGLLALGWLITNQVGRRAEQQMQDETLLRGRMLAASVNPDSLQQLAGTGADVQRPEYQQLKNRLMALRNANRQARFLYLVGQRNDQVFIWLDSEPPDSPDYSAPGDIYHEASADLRRVFRTGAETIEGPLPDRWGVWVSAFAPIKDARGRVLAVAGVDINAAQWAHLVAQARFWPILVQMLVVLILLSMFIFTHRWRDVAEQLAASEHQYRALFENNTTPMVLLDPAMGLMLDVNAAAAAYYGYARERMLGMAVSTVNLLDAPETATLLQQNPSQPLTYRARHRLAGGDLRDVQVLLSPLHVRGRRCLFAIIQDVTAQLAAERAVAAGVAERNRNEAQLRLQSAALNAAANGIVITDRAGAIVWANPAFATITGYTTEEVLGKNPRFLKSGRQGPAFYDELWRTISAGEVWQGEIINRRKEGRFYTEEMTITPVRNGAGEIAHFVAIKQDVTAQRELREQFLQAQRMESIGRLAAGVAHDFNNQLQGILGFGDLLKHSTDPSDPRRADIEELLKAAQQAAAISRQLLNFSRRQPADMQVLDLNQVIQGSQAMHQRLLGEDIQFELRLAAGLERIKANAGLMDQVLMNLLINARDAMPQGGRLTISTFNIALEARDMGQWNDARPGRFVVVAVSDTGAGVAPEHLPHIFEPFFTTKEKDRGTGLGLASVYGIARQHGGWVHVYSQQGIGTTFKVYLPALADRADSATATAPAAATPIVNGQQQHILLVEDETGVRLLAQRILQEHNYSVTAAASITEALKLSEAATTPFAMIFSDVVLPDGNGLELVEKLLQRQPGLRVIMASGYTDERSRWTTIQERGFRFLAKPYPIATLLRAVQETFAAPAQL